MDDTTRNHPRRSFEEKKKGLPRLIAAFTHSLAGLAAAYRNEEAFRQECWLALLLVPLALLLPVEPLSRILLVGSVLFLLIVELLNSAIEATLDRISLEYHPLTKRAKDIASAAVFLALLDLVFVWSVILGLWLFESI